MAKFKPRHSYKQAEDGPVASQGTGPSAGAASVPFDDELLQWAIRTFFDTLFKRSTDSITDAQAVAAFQLVVTSVSHLSADDRTELIRDMDFFVGRIKSHIEPVLTLWYSALNAK